MIALTEKFWWYAARSSGLVLWLVIAVSVGWGFAVSARLVRRKGLPAWMLDLHKHLSWLALAFTGVHLFSLWADSYATFGLAELLVPMASGWRPGAVAWGIGAMYLLVVVQVTSQFMRRLPRRLWHAIHYASLPLLVAGTVHGILAGADWGTRAVDWRLILAVSSVVWLGTFRALGPAKRTPTRTADQLRQAAREKQRAVPDPEPGWPPPALAEEGSMSGR